MSQADARSSVLATPSPEPCNREVDPYPWNPVLGDGWKNGPQHPIPTKVKAPPQDRPKRNHPLLDL